MDDKSQPDAPAKDTGGQEPTQQEPKQEPASAEQSQKAVDTQPTQKDTPADDDFSNFAKGQGFDEEDLKDPKVQKALKIAQKSRSTATQSFNENRKLQEQLKNIGDKGKNPVADQEFDDPLEKKVAQLEESTNDQLWQASVGFFMAQHPDAVELVEDMDKIASDKPHLARDLETLYEIAKGRSMSPEQISAKAQAEERQRLAQASQAAPATANATQQELNDDVMSIELIQKKATDRQWYKKNKDRINEFLAKS